MTPTQCAGHFRRLTQICDKHRRSRNHYALPDSFHSLTARMQPAARRQRAYASHRPMLCCRYSALACRYRICRRGGLPPLRHQCRRCLKGGELTSTPTVSSQYISALLMVAPLMECEGLKLTLKGENRVAPSHTDILKMMSEAGIESLFAGNIRA